jgi:hypothetical protein
MSEKGDKLEQELATRVQEEYSAGFAHIRTERDRKQEVLEKILPV